MESEFLTDREKKVLEVDVRRKLYNIVKKYAGTHFREIERKSELATGSVQYHLNFLVKQNLIKLEKEGNNVRYFPKDFLSDNKRIMAFLRQRSVRNIILFVLTHNNCNHDQIVKFVKLSPSTVSWHLKKLEDENILGFVKSGRKTHYNVLIDRNEIMNLLITYQESFLDNLVDNIIEMWEIN
ncbi:winged helix-turn-helix transcriptional regulator [Candidatus Woesearchaeota archaeon]|nr:winged helix-turn-helix transcriptional regulator [Candidatus Woesearchaeota archaeon]